MDYAETMEYLKSLQKFGIRLGLHRMERLLAEFGNPHQEIPYVHIGGTNGKGSVTAMLLSVLKAAGYRMGTYISPALHRFNERIGIDGIPIADEELTPLITEIKPWATEIGQDGDHPTEFEVVTAAALLHFKRKNVQMGLLEVGLGGRLDSTNIIEKPLVSVITNIGYDHMQILGNTLEEIAFEKAGIIKEGRPLITGAEGDSVLKVLSDTAAQRNATLYRLGSDIQAEGLGGSWENQFVRIATMDSVYQDLEISLLGDHQISNAALALAALDILRREGFPVSEDAVRKGMKTAVWPGRFEVFQKRPLVIIDGAHNPDGARVLKKTLKKLAGGRKITMVVGILEDKDWETMVKEFAEVADRIVVVRPDSPRALNEQELAAAILRIHDRVHVFRHVREGMEFALATSEINDIICAAGSLVTAAEARSVIL